MEDNKSTSRYKDSGCSFVVEVQPDYDKEETEGNKGSSDDVTTGVTDQQALVHREEIPDDRSSGDYSRIIHNIFLIYNILLFYVSHRFRKYAIVWEHQYRSVTVRPFDIQSRFGQSELPLW